MNYYLSSILLLTTMLCCQAQEKSIVLTDSHFVDIIENYIKENDKIPNSCDATPFYNIHFKISNDSLSFWIGAHLGLPSPVLANEPGKRPPLDPIEIKGYTLVNKRLVIFYDYASSDGRGLYNPRKLNKYCDEAFEELPEGCENVMYPGALNYGLLKDSIYLKGKGEAFHLK